MSDNYITITTVAEIENPVEIKDRVIQWMQSKEFIESDLSDCIMSTKKKGYKPGKKHVDAIGYDEDILKWKVCGVETKTEREVFNAGAFTAMTKMECPSCGSNRFEGIKPQDFFTDNCTKEQLDLFDSVFPEFDKWTNGENATLTCPHCGSTSNIEKYKIDNSLSFSNFGLTFWNWPDLTTNFLEQLKSVIGIEIRRINGHI
jgi:DNA-directed RNA polymerase subunit RPC12/RpoP